MLTAIPDKWVRPTRRPADLSVGPTDLVGCLHNLQKTFQKIPLDDLIRHDLKTRCTEQDLVDYDQSRSTGYGKMCNIDLDLLVVTDGIWQDATRGGITWLAS
jgi:hypothetical protein